MADIGWSLPVLSGHFLLDLNDRPSPIPVLRELRTVLIVIDRFDTEIERVAYALADYALFHSLPGAGQHLSPRLLAAFGEQRATAICMLPRAH